MTRGRGLETITAIVEHIAAGTAAGLDYMFQKWDSVSAHYAVMKSGEIHQYVREEDAAWGAGILNHPDTSLPWLPPAKAIQGRVVNQRVISIEHEGQPGDSFLEDQFLATVALNRYLTAKWAIPIDRDHLVGHNRLDSVNRANCPGPSFPWEALFRALES